MTHTKMFKKKSQSERGASMVEYALLVALLALVAVGAVRKGGESVAATFTTVNEELKSCGIGGEGWGCDEEVDTPTL